MVLKGKVMAQVHNGKYGVDEWDTLAETILGMGCVVISSTFTDVCKVKPNKPTMANIATTLQCAEMSIDVWHTIEDMLLAECFVIDRVEMDGVETIG